MLKNQFYYCKYDFGFWTFMVEIKVQDTLDWETYDGYQHNMLSKE
jgi:hypothetical protein